MGAYRTLVGLTIAYVALLLLVALTPTGGPAAQDADAGSTPAPVTSSTGCVVCGIGETCDPVTGRCELAEYTPLPCIGSATFDEEAGFCLPTGESPLGDPEPPEEEAEEERDDERRGRVPREPREPRQMDLPGFGN